MRSSAALMLQWAQDWMFVYIHVKKNTQISFFSSTSRETKPVTPWTCARTVSIERGWDKKKKKSGVGHLWCFNSGRNTASFEITVESWFNICFIGALLTLIRNTCDIFEFTGTGNQNEEQTVSSEKHCRAQRQCVVGCPRCLCSGKSLSSALCGVFIKVTRQNKFRFKNREVPNLAQCRGRCQAFSLPPWRAASLAVAKSIFGQLAHF